MEILVLQPIVALVAGILILIVPHLSNYIVAIYLILIGLVGLLTDIIPYRLRNPTAEHTLDQRRLGWRLLPLSHPAAPIVTE